jgi:hypothetical protein
MHRSISVGLQLNHQHCHHSASDIAYRAPMNTAASVVQNVHSCCLHGLSESAAVLQAVQQLSLLTPEC